MAFAKGHEISNGERKASRHRGVTWPSVRIESSLCYSLRVAVWGTITGSPLRVGSGANPAYPLIYEKLGLSGLRLWGCFQLRWKRSSVLNPKPLWVRAPGLPRSAAFFCLGGSGFRSADRC